MVSSLGNDPNASRGKPSIELSASDKYSSEPSRPANEFSSMQLISLPLKSRCRSFFKLCMARDGTSTNRL